MNGCFGSGMTGRYLLTGLLLFLPVFSIFSDETGDRSTGGPVTLVAVSLEIDGSTSPKALMRELRVAEGDVFESYKVLEAILTFRIRELENRRLFREFEWELRPSGPEGAELEIQLADSFTILPRPMIKFSSTTGITLGAKVEYFNAFGTLTDWIVEAYWSPNEIKARIDLQEISVGPINLDFAFEQYYGATKYGSVDGDILAEYDSMHSLVSGKMHIPLGPTSPWSYELEPLFQWNYSYNWVSNTTGIPESEFENPGFAVGLDHGFYTDQVYWEGNFRRGFEFSFMNDNLFYTRTGNRDQFLESDFYGYLPLSSWFEISGRVGGFFAIEGIRENAGDRLRGVVDYQTWGNWGVFASAQFNFRVTPSGGFLEVQLRPFVDAGYVVADDAWGSGPDAWEYCVGSTAIFFMKPLPSMVLNVEAGWDFKRREPEIIFDTKLLL